MLGENAERYSNVSLDFTDIDGRKIYLYYTQESPGVFSISANGRKYPIPLPLYTFLEEYTEAVANVDEDIEISLPGKNRGIFAHIATSLDSLVLIFLMEAEKFDKLT